MGAAEPEPAAEAAGRGSTKGRALAAAGVSGLVRVAFAEWVAAGGGESS